MLLLLLLMLMMMMLLLMSLNMSIRLIPRRATSSHPAFLDTFEGTPPAHLFLPVQCQESIRLDPRQLIRRQP
jgi:hypothetical protein